MKRREGLTVFGLLAVQACLLAYAATRHNPTIDEAAHLAAGLSHWQFGNFRLYRVNPPLMRMIAAVPVLCAAHSTDWQPAGGWHRPEFGLGRSLVVANGQRSVWLFTLARWMMIPLALAGGYACWRWARELYGGQAGLVALVLWCFSPTILAFGHLLVPDVAASSLGAIAGFCFWAWLRNPKWGNATLAAVFFGLAQAAKMTWVILWGLWPIMWLLYRRALRHRNFPAASLRQQLGQMAMILVGGLLVLNAVYGFEGTMQPLGDYDFVSRWFTGHQTLTIPPAKGNRFRDTIAGRVPVPLPANYVGGIDEQKFDFEHGSWSYLRGQWRERGWWYYYLYAIGVKEPLGVLALAGVALCTMAASPRAWRGRGEMVVLAPAVVLFLFVSSQTGFSHHMRYVLPAYPFFFVWMGRVAGVPKGGPSRPPSPARRRGLLVLLLAWATASSLWAYPHSLAYFNESVGGPRNGHFHLLNSNIDWGQDLLYLKRWLEAHPAVRLDGLAYAYSRAIPPEVFGLPTAPVPPDPGWRKSGAASGGPHGPQPGWYAVSVSLLHDRNDRFKYLYDFRAAAFAGYSIVLYCITPEDAGPKQGLPCTGRPE